LELRQDIGFQRRSRSKLQNFFGTARCSRTSSSVEDVPVPSPDVPDDVSRDILAGANITTAQIVPLISDDAAWAP